MPVMSFEAKTSPETGAMSQRLQSETVEGDRLARFPQENPNPVMQISRQGAILFANQGARPLLGKWRISPGGNVPALWAERIAGVILSGHPADFEIQAGTEMFNLSVVPIVGTDYANIYGLNITRLKKVERDLKTSEERFRAIFENAGDAIILWGMPPENIFGGRQPMPVLEANHIACERYGYSHEEMQRLTSAELNTQQSFDRVNTNQLEKLVRGGHGTYEVVHRAKNGEEILSEVSGHFFYFDGRPVVLSVIRDIRARKEAEKKLNDAYEREKMLHRKVEEEVKQRAEFTRAIIHELKTPLTPILAASDMLAATAPEGTLARLAGQVHRGAQELNNRISELFDLARGEMGMLNLKYGKVDALALFGDVIEYFQPQARQKRILLHADLPSALPEVWADEKKLRQVLVNLLDNALKFTPREGTVTLAASVRGGRLNIIVADSGPGMSVAEQARLFQPYSRLAGSQKHNGGLGLGLSLCRTFVELHGGRISVKSHEGAGGSKFEINIPVGESKQMEKGDSNEDIDS